MELRASVPGLPETNCWLSNYRRRSSRKAQGFSSGEGLGFLAVDGDIIVPERGFKLDAVSRSEDHLGALIACADINLKPTTTAPNS